MKKIKVDWKTISWVMIFLILYTIINMIWMDFLYINDSYFNIYTTLGIAIILVLPYSYLNSKVEFGNWYIVFLIPFSYIVLQMLLSQFWYMIFPNPYKSDDLGAGILALIIFFLHWLSIIISIYLGYVIKGYRTKKI